MFSTFLYVLTVVSQHTRHRNEKMETRTWRTKSKFATSKFLPLLHTCQRIYTVAQYETIRYIRLTTSVSGFHVTANNGFNILYTRACLVLWKISILSNIFSSSVHLNVPHISKKCPTFHACMQHAPQFNRELHDCIHSVGSSPKLGFYSYGHFPSCLLPVSNRSLTLPSLLSSSIASLHVFVSQYLTHSICTTHPASSFFPSSFHSFILTVVVNVSSFVFLLIPRFRSLTVLCFHFKPKNWINFFVEW